MENTLINSVRIAFNTMPTVFYANELIPKVFNPNNSHGGMITKSLRNLRKQGKIKYAAYNTGLYIKL